MVLLVAAVVPHGTKRWRGKVFDTTLVLKLLLSTMIIIMKVLPENVAAVVSSSVESITSRTTTTSSTTTATTATTATATTISHLHHGSSSRGRSSSSSSSSTNGDDKQRTNKNDDDDDFWSTFSGTTIVDYGPNGHPFEKKEQKQLEQQQKEYQHNNNYDRRAEEGLYGQNERTTQQQQSSSSSSSNGGGVTMEPIRISFASYPIMKQISTNNNNNNNNNEMNTKIDYILNTILVEAATIWSNHLSVVPIQNILSIGPGACNNKFNDIPYQEFNNTDLVIIVDGEWTINCETAVAYASICNLDQIGRPILGFMNFCLSDPNNTNNTNNTTTNKNVDPLSSLQDLVISSFGKQLNKTLRTNHTEVTLLPVTIHEMAHVLGVISPIFVYYRNKDNGGIPYTEPESITNNSTTTTTPPAAPEVPIIEKRCGNGTLSNGRYPSDSMVQTILQQSSNGRYGQYIVTPRVKQVTQNHFNCTSLIGARLEDHQGCIGSHWHERELYTELLSPLISSIGQNVLSPFTLALLDDSGWYQVDYSGSQVPTFGVNAGCTFLTNDCIVNETTTSRSEFCSTPVEIISFGTGTGTGSTSSNADIDSTTTTMTVLGEETLHNVFCDPSHQSYAACDLFEFTDDANFANLSSSFTSTVSYFSNKNLRPQVTTADSCPIPAIPLGLDCTRSDEYNPFYPGEQVGPGSRCFNAYYNGTSTITNTPKIIYQPACMKVTCDQITNMVYIQVENESIVCQYDGQVIPLPGTDNGGFLLCPRLAILCPNLYTCPGSCSGRGVCVYDSGTTRPYCNCLNKTNTDEMCSDPAVVASRKQKPTVAPTNVPPPQQQVSTPTSISAPATTSSPSQQQQQQRSPSTQINGTPVVSPGQVPINEDSSSNIQPTTEMTAVPTSAPMMSSSSCSCPIWLYSFASISFLSLFILY